MNLKSQGRVTLIVEGKPKSFYFTIYAIMRLQEILKIDVSDVEKVMKERPFHAFSALLKAGAEAANAQAGTNEEITIFQASEWLSELGIRGVKPATEAFKESFAKFNESEEEEEVGEGHKKK